MTRSSILRVAALAILLPVSLVAQEDNLPSPSSQVGAYDLFGTLKAGYRVVSVNSDQEGEFYSTNAENLFREQYSLTDSGFALGRQLPVSLDLFAAKRLGEAGFFDQLFLNVDLNPTVAGGSLRLRQFGAFDFNLGYHHVDYFYDRYDSLFQDLRRYETNRSDLDASLDVSLTDMFGVGLSYRGIGHAGAQQMPRPMFLEGATGLASWMAVSRLYYLTELPRTDWNSEFSGSLNADLDVVSIVVGGGVTSFTEDYRVSPVTGENGLSLAFRDTNNTAGGFANEFGIVGDQTARERLLAYEHTEDRELSGPHFFAQAVLRPVDIFSLTADFRMDQLEGTTGIRTSQRAEARKSNAARAFQLYTGTYTGEDTTTLDRLRASVSATVSPIPELSVTAGWRMQQDETTARSAYHLAFDSTTSLTSTEFRTALGADSLHEMTWKHNSLQPVQTLFGSVTVAPMRELTLSAGVRVQTRSPEVSRSEDGEVDSVITTNMSKETSGLGFDIGASYRPIPELRVRARFEMMNREATFTDDPLEGGPAAGTVTDLEPRTAPEDVTRVNASIDWEIVEGFDAGVRFGMRDAKANLDESMWVLDGPSNAVELVDDQTTVSGLLRYRVDQNTTIRLSGETRSSSFSIPVTWTRGQELITPLFPLDPGAPPISANEYDSATVVFAQETDDLYIDFGVATRLIDALTLGAGISYLAVTGEPTTTAEVKSETGTPVRGLGDVTRTGGPFNRTIITGNIGYDITEQFGLAVDVMYAMQDEDEVKDDPAVASASRWFYGYDDYNGLSAAFSVVYNF